MNSTTLLTIALIDDFAAFGVLLQLVLGAIVTLILIFAWVLLPLTLSRKLSEIRNEARRQTLLLERIADKVAPAEPLAQGEKDAPEAYKIPGLSS